MPETPNLLDRGRDGLGRAQKFLTREVWNHDYSRQPGVRGFLLRQVQVVLLVAKGLKQNAVDLRAGTLSLITLFSVVPALAVIFSIFKAVGGLERVEAQLQSFIYQNIAVGAQDEFVAAIERFIGNISGGAVGGLGTLLLVAAAIRLMTAVETSFNEIWGVRRSRPLVNRLVIHWVLLTLGPIALATSLAGTAALQGWLSKALVFPGAGWLFSLAPAAITVTALTLVYLVIPNTEVRFRHALTGALTAGVIFELAKWGYAWVASSFFRYNAIYGSVGAIPVFIIWVNIAWIVVLFGCQLTYAHQNVGTLRQEEGAHHASEQFREILAARLMLDVASDFVRGRDPATSAELSRRVDVPLRLVLGVLRTLADAGLLREVQLTDRQDPGHVPGRPLEGITVGQVVQALRDRQGTDLELREDQGREILRALFQEAREAESVVVDRVDYRSLVDGGPASEVGAEGAADTGAPRASEPEPEPEAGAEPATGPERGPETAEESERPEALRSLQKRSS